jgi:hypothetical protein
MIESPTPTPEVVAAPILYCSRTADDFFNGLLGVGPLDNDRRR